MEIEMKAKLKDSVFCFDSVTQDFQKEPLSSSTSSKKIKSNPIL